VTRARLARAAIASAVFGALAHHARRGEVSALEERAFRAANALPDAAHGPVWVVMQGGSLAGVWVVAGATALAGRRELSARLAVAGTVVWGFCKLIKHDIQRGRPGAHLLNVVVRGAPQSGLGFPSGHTAVAFTLAGVAAPSLPLAGRVVAYSAAGIVGLARQYVGAHLPVDVAGGFAIGVAVAAVAHA
jgi:undecaprenyl-diphosphatase